MPCWLFEFCCHPKLLRRVWMKQGSFRDICKCYSTYILVLEYSSQANLSSMKQLSLGGEPVMGLALRMVRS